MTVKKDKAMRRRPLDEMLRYLAASVLAVTVLAAAACGGAAAVPGTTLDGAIPTDSAAADPPGGGGDFTLTTSAIVDGELLPEFRGEPKVNGVEESIPLAWENVPEGTGALAIIMHHFPDPNDKTKVNQYLLLWGIDPSVTAIPHGGADDGDWFMGPNKDGVVVSYTSPNSKGAGVHEYTITIYALTETPESLPKQDSLDVTYQVLTQAISTVTVIDTATLTFKVTTP
jgi:phosphatidylethanolamine-binding protein (PEBP) family uncharacterized protein